MSASSDERLVREIEAKFPEMGVRVTDKVVSIGGGEKIMFPKEGNETRAIFRCRQRGAEHRKRRPIHIATVTLTFFTFFRGAFHIDALFCVRMMYLIGMERERGTRR